MTSITANNLSLIYQLVVPNSSKGYSKTTALDGLSFEFKLGDRVGVIGPNGSGKSSLLRVIGGGLPPTKGKLNITGDVLSMMNRTSGLIRNASLLENARIKGLSLLLSGSALDKFIKTALLQSGLVDRQNHSLNSLSTGMVGRFSIAINSQIFKPITIMDEWVGTVESAQFNSFGIVDNLVNSADILIMASHNEILIRSLCNKVLLLDFGRIKYFGNDFNHAFYQLGTLNSTVNRELSHKNQGKRKERINILSFGKTGSYILRKIIETAKSDKYIFVIHKIGVTLKDIPAGERVAFFIRDPIERFCRAFNGRKNQGVPFYDSKWNQKEKEVFNRFESANQLAEALCSKSTTTQFEALRTMNIINYLANPMSDYIAKQEHLLARQQDLSFIGDAGELYKEVERFKSVFELDVDVSQLMNEELLEHFNQRQVSELSDSAKSNLKLFYKEDIKYFSQLQKTHIRSSTQ